LGALASHKIAAMAEPLTLWIHAQASPDPGYGGWAFVIANGVAITGAAGGARAVSAQTMLMTALIEALPRIDPAQPATIRCNIAPEQAAAPPELWTPFAALYAARPTTLNIAEERFTKAWADEGQKLSKTRGAFQAAIPKPNFKGFSPAPR
jgi:ribonuclease HI